MESIQYKRAKEIYAYTADLIFDQRKEKLYIIDSLICKGIDCYSALEIVNQIEKENKNNSDVAKLDLSDAYFNICAGLWSFIYDD